MFIPVVLAACAGAQTAQSATTPGGTFTSTGATGAGITEADLRKRLYIVADDSMGGRPTGSPGHIKTSQYIADEMRRLGLQPAGDNGTYFQNVPFVRRALTTNELTADGAALTARTDFVPQLSGLPPQPINNADAVYGGVVDDSATWISADQAAGKLVVFRLSSLQVLQTGIPSVSRNPRFARASGVALTGFAQVWPQLVNFVSPGTQPLYKSPSTPFVQLPVSFFLSDAAAQRILGAAANTLQPGALGKKISARVAWTDETLLARNVVAILPGSDAALRGQYVALSAHQDHDPPRPRAVDHDSLKVFNAISRKMEVDLGRDVTPQELATIKVNVDSLRLIRPPRRDSIMNGADDDGSGTVALIEIAESMARGNNKPRRSALFVWHVAEELGLFGAQHFTDFPTVPRDSIAANLNMDMIGRGGPGEEPGAGPAYLQLIGWRRLSNQLGDVIDQVNKERSMPFKFDLTYDAAGHPEQFYCRSDHERYARYGIPVAFFSTGSHGDYHQVTDEPQYIDYTKLMNVAQFVHDIGLRVAALPTRPKVDGTVSGPNAPCRQ